MQLEPLILQLLLPLFVLQVFGEALPHAGAAGVQLIVPVLAVQGGGGLTVTEFEHTVGGVVCEPEVTVTEPVLGPVVEYDLVTDAVLPESPSVPDQE